MKGGIVVVQLIQGKTFGQGWSARPVRGVDVEFAAGGRGVLWGRRAASPTMATCFIEAHLEVWRKRHTPIATGPNRVSWWAETERYFDGPVGFVDSADVDVQVEPSNDAGFVQVIQSNARDRQRIEEINAEVGPAMTESQSRDRRCRFGVVRRSRLRHCLLHDRGGGPCWREEGDGPRPIAGYLRNGGR